MKLLIKSVLASTLLFFYLASVILAAGYASSSSGAGGGYLSRDTHPMKIWRIAGSRSGPDELLSHIKEHYRFPHAVMRELEDYHFDERGFEHQLQSDPDKRRILQLHPIEAPFQNARMALLTPDTSASPDEKTFALFTVFEGGGKPSIGVENIVRISNARGLEHAFHNSPLKGPSRQMEFGSILSSRDALNLFTTPRLHP